MISVIVPVYNVELYLKECIESILTQTYTDLEIILVNDGSTDNSIKICEDYASKDKRIKVINKVNGGLSDARNVGLKIATGEYISFIDSDDYIINKDAYENMYKIAKENNSSLVAGNALWYYSDNDNFVVHTEEQQFSNNRMTGEEFFIKSLKTKRLIAPVCFNLYKRELLIENKLVFKTGIHHEDEEFTPRVLLKCKCISNYNEPFYVYRQRKGSITNGIKNKKQGIDILNICLSFDNIVNKIDNKELKFLFKKYLATLSIEQIYKYRLKNISREIKNNILNNSVTFGQKVRSFLISKNITMFLVLEECHRAVKNKL